MLLFMPWCRLDKPYQIGGMTILPYGHDEQIVRLTDSARSAVRAIMATYKTIEGKPIDRAALVRYSDKQLLDDLTDDEIAQVREILALVCFCGLANRQYFSPVGDYCNTDTFSLHVQKFSDAEFTALRTRRREGYTLSGWPMKDISITIPTHCHTVRTARLSETLLTALGEYRAKAASSDWPRWQNALACFNQANTDADTVSHQVEWVLSCSAFEHLLGAKPDAKDVSRKFSEALGFPKPLSVRHARRRNSSWSNQDNTLSYEWMREFYRIRGDFAHGKLKTQQPATWNALEHLVLAAIAFPLLVKCLLAKSPFYKLTNVDQAQLDAFEEFADTPNFMMPPSDQKGGLDSHWSRICDRHKLNAGIARAVNEAWREVTAAHENCDAKPDNETGAGGAV